MMALVLRLNSAKIVWFLSATLYVCMSSINGEFSILIIKHSENASVQDLSRTGLLRPFRGKNA